MSVRPYIGKKKKPGEIWWIIDLHRKGMRHTPFCGSFEDAKKLEMELRSGDVVVPSACRIRDLIVPYLQWYRTERSETTLRDLRFSIDLYIVPVFGNLTPGGLTVQLFNEFKSELLKKGLTRRTINKHLDYFSGLLRWSAENGYCLPLAIQIPKFAKKATAPAEPTKPLTRRQLEALYSHISPEYRLLFLLMADQALRLDEALHVQVDDIDETRRTISVLGKGNKRRLVPFLTTRFEKQLIRVLDKRLDGYLVVNPKTKKPYSTMWKELQRARKAAGLTRKVNHHILRHTCATLLAEAGINAHALQIVLGHESIEITTKIYINVGQDFVGNEAEKMRVMSDVTLSIEKTHRNHLKLLG